MKSYHGWRDDNGSAQVIILHNGVTALPLRLDLDNHSPTGFEWGYGGSGPAQLALALLADRLPDDGDLAYQLHQHFKWAVVCQFPKSGWIIDAYEIDQWIYSRLDKYELVPVSTDSDECICAG
jgi:hypothetical protein